MSNVTFRDTRHSLGRNKTRRRRRRRGARVDGTNWSQSLETNVWRARGVSRGSRNPRSARWTSNGKKFRIINQLWNVTPTTAEILSLGLLQIKAPLSDRSNQAHLAARPWWLRVGVQSAANERSGWDYPLTYKHNTRKNFSWVAESSNGSRAVLNSESWHQRRPSFAAKYLACKTLINGYGESLEQKLIQSVNCRFIKCHPNYPEIQKVLNNCL